MCAPTKIINEAEHQCSVVVYIIHNLKGEIMARFSALIYKNGPLRSSSYYLNIGQDSKYNHPVGEFGRLPVGGKWELASDREFICQGSTFGGRFPETALKFWDIGTLKARVYNFSSGHND
jgi:hypothetical protein